MKSLSSVLHIHSCKNVIQPPLSGSRGRPEVKCDYFKHPGKLKSVETSKRSESIPLQHEARCSSTQTLRLSGVDGMSLHRKLHTTLLVKGNRVGSLKDKLVELMSTSFLGLRNLHQHSLHCSDHPTFVR